MSRSIRRAASPESPLVIGYLTGHLSDVPPSWGLVTVGGPMGGARDVVKEIGSARAATGSQGPLALVGFSAGCQAVRELLRAGARPCAVVALDGTAGDWPGPSAAQLAPWQAYAERARLGEVLLVVTCTEQVYTEQIPRRGKDFPYASTLRVATAIWYGLSAETARAATRDALLAPGDYIEEGLRVEVHDTTNIDGGAHLREINEHGPRILREHVVPWIEARL